MATIRYDDHTDNLPSKLELLKSAYSQGHLDVAMSLAESIKDNLEFERRGQSAGNPQISPETFFAVSQLPRALAEWARGWSFLKPVTLCETVGIRRSAEPVDLSIGIRTDQITDPARELRVAQWDPAQHRLREVRSQVYSTTRENRRFRCQVVFLADVERHEAAHYFVFYGNPHAELPDYPSDLRVDGEGYGLDVSNQHYHARLSRQNGQLERLTFAREHGLELYAGGKGHGEAPDIDWGHDYVDQGQLQKLRMRNAPRWVNYEVVRGPLCVQIRRWGFPYSPLHPVFTPSRVHMDITYSFYAGAPYFLKQGRIDVVKDVAIEAMRDDEWVFSGYSFTDPVWIDSAGRLHEGPVPPGHVDALWGVGFFNRVSRDAFIALRLEHSAERFEGLKHGGAPNLHYAGHGQLWSRYPSGPAKLRADASFRQKSAYLVGAYPERDAATSIEQLRHRLLNRLEVHTEMPRGLTAAAAAAAASAEPRLARHGETPETARLKETIWKTLRDVRDEQFYAVDANIVDMGYVYDVREREGIVRVVVTMPHRGRPVYQFLEWQGGGRVDAGIRERLLKIKGVRDVIVDFTWEPAWTQARLTDDGRRAMGLPPA